MYEERKEKFSFKSFFLTLLLVLLFVFLMLWLFPNKWDLKSLQTNQSTYDIEKLSVLYDEIFAKNIERMKDSAVGYFTNERMPQKVGDTKKLTLKKMYELHLILKLKDKNGKACDETKSYVEMTKYDDEYRLKVNLSCGTDEDYIIVYLGCYSYCNNGVCEKRVDNSKTTTSTSKDGKVSTTTEPKKTVYSCKIVDGKYYNKGGNVVSKEDYEKSCSTPSEDKHSCEIVNGKYYDKDGKVVNKTEYNKSCIAEEEKKYTCKVVDGKYYDNTGKVVSKEEYNSACVEPEKTYSCEVVDGKYYNKSGKEVNETDYKKSCGLLKTMYEYELKTSGETTCLAWSKWQKEKVTATQTREVQTKTENEVVDYTTKKIKTGEKKETVVREVQEKYIVGYTTKLVYVGTKDIQVGTKTEQVTEQVAVATVKVKAGIGSGTVVPANTATNEYVVLSQDTVASCSNCEKKVVYTWQIYNIETKYETVTKEVEVPVYKTVKVYEDQQVPVYDYRTVEKEEVVVIPIYTDYKIPVYGDVMYYRYRNCSTKVGTSDKKWSYSKTDSELLSKGYKLTGNTKQV